MATDAQINANRSNAQKSTGPSSPEGRAKSSLNAVKTGLTGRTVLLPGDDAEAYKKHVQRFFDRHEPVGDDEQNLVQSLADTEWRLLRIPGLEMGIYAIGHLEFAERFASETDETTRRALIEAQIFLAYQRQLNNLSVQERRLRSQRQQDLTDLQKLQAERVRVTTIRLNDAVELYEELKKEGKPFDPAEFGFEFSREQFQEHLVFLEARRKRENENNAVLKFRRDRKAA